MKKKLDISLAVQLLFLSENGSLGSSSLMHHELMAFKAAERSSKVADCQSKLACWDNICFDMWQKFCRETVLVIRKVALAFEAKSIMVGASRSPFFFNDKLYHNCRNL